MSVADVRLHTPRGNVHTSLQIEPYIFQQRTEVDTWPE